MLANVFESDLFSFTSLTTAVNNIPFVPQHLSLWLPWNAKGVNTRTITIEEKAGALSLVPTRPYGAPATQIAEEKRDAVLLQIPRRPRERTIMADEVQGVRKFGSDNEMETVEERVNEKQTQMVREHEATWEFGRAGAISGLIRDADGTVLVDTHAKFGVERNTYSMALGTSTTDIIDELTMAKEQAEDELSDTFIVDGYILVAGRTLFRRLSTHASLKEAYQRWNSGQLLRADKRPGFMVSDDINVVSYSRGKFDGMDYIDPNKGYLCPVVSSGLYETRFAPGSTMSAVNTEGLPLYSTSKLIGHEDGVEIRTESNSISYVSKPRCIVEISSSN